MDKIVARFLGWAPRLTLEAATFSQPAIAAPSRSAVASGSSLVEALQTGLWFAVPKKKVRE